MQSNLLQRLYTWALILCFRISFWTVLRSRKNQNGLKGYCRRCNRTAGVLLIKPQTNKLYRCHFSVIIFSNYVSWKPNWKLAIWCNCPMKVLMGRCKKIYDTCIVSSVLIAKIIGQNGCDNFLLQQSTKSINFRFNYLLMNFMHTVKVYWLRTCVTVFVPS